VRTLYLICSLLALSVAAPALAADPPSTVSGVTVTAKRDAKKSAEAVAQFVDQISTASRFKQMARWDRSICPGVLGLPANHAQYLNDRLAANAVAVGLKTGAPGCRANVLILVAPDADAFVAEIAKKHALAFGVNGNGGADTRGKAAFADFVATSRPVRWWHISETAGVDGTRLSTPTGTSGHGLGVPMLEVHGASRLRPNVQEVFANVIIIIDAKRATGVSYQALCDYVSMVALAQVDPRAETTALPSILNLFADRDAGRPLPEALTEWDRNYLTSLYEVRPDTRTDKQEREEITDAMRKKAAEPPAPK
jgi:hypothetical protein